MDTKDLTPKPDPEMENKAGGWKQGFLVVPAVDIFKPDTIRQTLEWFNGQTGRN
jgi:hypothetical protein